MDMKEVYVGNVKKYQQLCIDQICNAFLQKKTQAQALGDIENHYHLQLN
jgi:hypothetical protein